MFSASEYPSAYQAIIFDLDGTLIDSRADIAAALNHTRVKNGYAPLPLEIVLPMIGNGLAKLVERGFSNTSEPLELRISEALAYYNEHLVDLTVVYPGVREVLAQLKNFKLAIVSNKPTVLLEPILKQLHLQDVFSDVFGGESFPERKPHPAAALHLLDQWKLKPTQVLMVGDMTPDAEFAKAAGMDFAHCTYGYHPEPLQAKFHFKKISELLPILLPQNR
jgi:phosphoglycolate phosphatase